MTETHGGAEPGHGDSAPVPPEDAAPAPAPGSHNGEDIKRSFIVNVALSSGGKISKYFWNSIELKVGDLCVVEELDRHEFGTVTITRRPECCPNGKKKRGKIVRKATADDKENELSNSRKEVTAMNFCRERILERDLPMSLSRVHYTLDGRKAVFFFTAEHRIDFRELVKDLSNFTRIKVEMRQIGVRDEARIIGGCGPCGQELCCSTFLTDFAPVSIRMAKDQLMSLSPEKISGVCGRLMCCLAYEHGTYKELQKSSPKMGKMVDTPEGRSGRVCQLNLLTEKVGVEFDDGVKVEYHASELTRRGPGGGGKPRRQENEPPRTEKAPPPAPIADREPPNPEPAIDAQPGEQAEERDQQAPSKRRRRGRKNRNKGQGQKAQPAQTGGQPKSPAPKPSAPPRPSGGERETEDKESRRDRKQPRRERTGRRRKPPQEGGE